MSRLHRIARGLAPFLLLLASTTALLNVTAAPAAAAFGIDCKEAPAPESPGGGIAGFFGIDGTGNPEGEAWRNGAPAFDQYGLAGLGFDTYDLGCGPDAARSPDAVIGTMIGNWGMEATKFGTTGTIATLQAAYEPTYLQTFDPLLERATAAIRYAIYEQWVPVTLLVVGLLVVWRSRRVQWSSVATTFGWALLVMGIATALFRYPVEAGQIADESVGTTLSAVNKGINGGTSEGVSPADAASEGIVHAVLWEQWKMGTFGRGNGDIAEKYARDIYTATALTYSEAALVASDPDGAGADLLERKAEQYEEAAENIAEESPEAYAHLTGKESATRIAAALIALFAMLCVVPFVLAACLLLIGAFLIIRLAVVFFPLLATIGVAHQARGAITGIGTVVAAALVNSVMFGVVLAVSLLGQRILLASDSGLPLWLALLLTAVFTAIMWVATKPLRRLTQMARPASLFKDAAGAAGSIGSGIKDTTVKGAGLLATAGASGLGAAAGHLAADKATEDRRAERAGRAENYDPYAYTQVSAQPHAAEGYDDAGAAGALPAPGPTGPAPLPSGGGGGATTGEGVTYVGRHAAPAGALPAGPSVEHTAEQPYDTPRTQGAGERATVAGDLYVPTGATEAPAPVTDAPPAPALVEPALDADGEQVYTLYVPEDTAQENHQ